MTASNSWFGSRKTGARGHLKWIADNLEMLSKPLPDVPFALVGEVRQKLRDMHRFCNAEGFPSANLELFHF